MPQRINKRWRSMIFSAIGEILTLTADVAHRRKRESRLAVTTKGVSHTEAPQDFPNVEAGSSSEGNSLKTRKLPLGHSSHLDRYRMVESAIRDPICSDSIARSR
jgi:hypothetical protein